MTWDEITEESHEERNHEEEIQKCLLKSNLNNVQIGDFLVSRQKKKP